MKKIIIGLLLLSQGILFAQEKTKIILFAGQSNTQGRGDFSKLTPEETKLLTSAKEKISLALFEKKKKTIAPLHPVKATPRDTELFGPEWFFGPELFIGLNLHKQYPEQEFLFIKHAIGGTSLHAAWNVNWDENIGKGTPDAKHPRLYYTWVDYVKEVLNGIDMTKYEIVGMFWIQGESDNPGFNPGKKEQYALHYKENLINLINKVREDLDKPALPFYALQIGKLPFKEVANELKNVYILPHDGFKGTGKYIYPKYPHSHYNYTGMSKIGTNFSEMYIENSGHLIQE